MVIVERATAGDLDGVSAVDRVVFGGGRRPEQLREAIADGACWLARSGGAVVGFAIFDRFLHGHGFLRVIAVHPDHRKQGVASALVRHLEGICPTDRLFTSTTRSNATMHRVAEALGFVKSGEIHDVDDDDVEVVYVKRLTPS